MVECLAAEEEQADTREQLGGEGRVCEAGVGKRRGRDPHLDARGGEVCEERAVVGELGGVHGIEAAARGERAHELELREIERVVRLVEEHAAALAHGGEACEPAAEVRDV